MARVTKVHRRSSIPYASLCGLVFDDLGDLTDQPGRVSCKSCQGLAQNPTGKTRLRKSHELDDEIRIVDPDTGGEKGAKLAQFHLIPAKPLWKLAEHYGAGAKKYSDRNWERGVRWSLNFSAMMRHAWKWWMGERDDPETGTHHLAAVAWHAFALMEYEETHPELDDRPKGME